MTKIARNFAMMLALIAAVGASGLLAAADGNEAVDRAYSRDMRGSTTYAARI